MWSSSALLAYVLVDFIFDLVFNKQIKGELETIAYRLDHIESQRLTQLAETPAVSRVYPHALERQFSDALREYYNGRVHGGEVPGYPEAPIAPTTEPIGYGNDYSCGMASYGNGAMAQSTGTSSVQCTPSTVPAGSYIAYNSTDYPTCPSLSQLLGGTVSSSELEDRS